LEHSMHWFAALETRDLRNYENRELRLAMMLAVMNERFCRLLGRSYAQVRDDAAMHRMRIVKIHDLLGKIRAVRVQQLVRSFIRCRVQSADKRIVLLGPGSDAKSVKRSVICRTSKLITRLGTGKRFLRQGQRTQKLFPQKRD